MTDRTRVALASAYEQIKGVPMAFGDDVRLDEAEMDSLDLLEAAVLVEHALGLRAPLEPRAFVGVNTFAELIAVLDAAAAKGAAASPETSR